MKKHMKLIHKLIVALTCILPLLAVFNENLWFDEAYSVGLVHQNWSGLLNAAINDVHPVLYYILLKLFTMVLGNSMIVFRIFSLLPIVILSILSFTHIRKEFGEKVGLYFAVILCFLPITIHYATQIRMYTWALLFVSITAFYAYKAFKDTKTKDWIIFAIFSLASAYTHYFGLFTIGIINLVLLYYVIKYKKELLKKWFLFGAIQIVAYLPGLFIFFKQSMRVAGGFWISVTYPDIIMQIVEFFFKDNITIGIASIFGVFIFIYVLLKMHTQYLADKKKIQPAVISLCVCGLVILATLAISLIRPIFIPRYMIPMAGIAIFAFAYVLSLEDRTWIKGIIIGGLVVLSVYNGYLYLEKSYSEENKKPIEFIKSEIQPNDIFIYTNINNGSLTSLEFTDHKQYFYNKDHWTVQDAYGAFLPQMECIEDLKTIEEFSGRIWVIDASDTNVYETIQNMQGTAVKIEKTHLYHPYSDNTFVISLFEKQ